MKKIWSYIAIFFIGVSAGLIAMYKLAGETVKVEVRKIKNKRTSGNTTTTVPINVESSRKGRKPKRDKEKKDTKKPRRKN